MRRSLRWLLIVVLALAVWLLALHLGWIHYSNQICSQGYKAGPPDCTAYDPSLVFLADAGWLANWISPVLTALATVAIAAFTVVLARTSRKQGEITREAMVEDKRAFVFAEGVLQFWEIDAQTGHYNWRFRAIIKNSGETPSKNMQTVTECEIRNNAYPPGHVFTPQTRNIVKGLVPPKSGVSGNLAPFPPDTAITPQDIIDCQAGTKYIYIWGWIKYHDTMPGTKEHVTKFCWSIKPTGNPLTYNPSAVGQTPTVGIMHFSFTYHGEHNCADDECE